MERNNKSNSRTSPYTNTSIVYIFLVSLQMLIWVTPAAFAGNLNLVGRQGSQFHNVRIVDLRLGDLLVDRKDAAGVDRQVHSVGGRLDLIDDRRRRRRGRRCRFADGETDNVVGADGVTGMEGLGGAGISWAVAIDADKHTASSNAIRCVKDRMHILVLLAVLLDTLDPDFSRLPTLDSLIPNP